MSEFSSAVSDWSSSPAATIKALLSKKKWATSDFAKRIGMNAVDANKLLDGLLSIDSLIAQDLEKVLGGSAKFWLKRELEYRVDRENEEALNPDHWIKTLPVKEMRDWGWISATDDAVASCKDFFAVETVRDWRIKYQEIASSSYFRRTSSSLNKTGVVSAWLRYQELQAFKIDCAPWSAAKFEASFEEIKSLTFEREPASFIPKLRRICAECGVAVVVARSPAGSTISGAAMFLNEYKAVIALSFRHLSDDHLWFTFFHEAGHLILHAKNGPFVDDEGTQSADDKEDEA
ncbi:ImmA/IrrE family metallo-endopeptidase, partial [Xanthomonas hortorum]